MGKIIEERIRIAKQTIQNIKDRIYDKGKRKEGLSDEYFDEKYKLLKQREELVESLEIINLYNAEMKTLLYPVIERNIEHDAIITVFFCNGKSITFRGCKIDIKATTNTTITFESDFGREYINITKIAGINIGFHGLASEKYIPELTGEIIVGDKFVNRTIYALDRLEEEILNTYTENQ